MGRTVKDETPLFMRGLGEWALPGSNRRPPACRGERSLLADARCCAQMLAAEQVLYGFVAFDRCAGIGTESHGVLPRALPPLGGTW